MDTPAKTTMMCPYCNLEVTVESRRQGLSNHIAQAHPQRLTDMRGRQAYPPRVGPVEFRCTMCESKFYDVLVYQMHHVKEHSG